MPPSVGTSACATRSSRRSKKPVFRADSTLVFSLRLQPNAEQSGARGHVQRLAVGVPEREAGGRLKQLDGVDGVAVRAVNGDTLRYRDEQVAFLVHANGVRHAGERANQDAFIGGVAVVVQVISAYIALVGIDHIQDRSEEHTSELQSLRHLVCRLL